MGFEPGTDGPYNGAVALVLAFTIPAFAGRLAAAKTEADCKKAGGMGTIANVTAALRWRISPRWSTCLDFLAQMNLV